MIQTYSSDMQPLSFEDKKIIHQKGLWHKVFTGILFNPDTNKIFFFLQTIFPKNSYDFDRPDFVDFSVGGHVENNETIQSQQITPISLTPERIIPDYFTDKSIAEKYSHLAR